MNYIGIDVGSSFVKGAVLDLEKIALRHVRRVHCATLTPTAQQAEIDPWQAVAAVRDMITSLLPYAEDCTGVVVCGQMHSLVLVDSAGKPLSKATTWQNQLALEPHPRAAGSYYDVMLRRLGPDGQRQLGNEVGPGLPLSVLFRLAERRELPASAIPVSLLSFVVAHLCEAPICEEVTMAAAAGALNLTTLAWHALALKELGLEKLRWPPVQSFRQPVGAIIGCERSLTCFPPVGDQQCALLGAFLAPSELSINISTGSQVAMLTNQLVLGDYQTRPYFAGDYLNTITRIPAGRALNVLTRLLREGPAAESVTEDALWQYITTQVEQVAGTDLQVDPAFFPSACGDRGSILNITEDNFTLGRLFYAAFARMALNYKACAERLSPAQARQRVVFSGGLALKQPVLRRLIIDQFQKPYRLCTAGEDTLLGLLILALVCAGKAATLDQAIALTQRSHQHLIEQN
jgi:sugar (pentulose or hexulose) kinase